MHVSRKADYAVRALAYLADHPGRRVLISEVAEKMSIPRAFLSKIMKELVQGGLALSQVGPGGGYSLAAEPTDITFRQILEVVEGPWSLVPCQGEPDDPCSMLDNCSQASVWDRIRREMLGVFDGYTLHDVSPEGLSASAPIPMPRAPAAS
jgi:Rrf2 family protein